MNAKGAIFALISIRSQPLRKLVNRLPYAPSTVYNAVNQLEMENRLRTVGGTVMLVEDYETQKLSEIYVQSLAHGIDPELLMRDSTLSVWKALGQVSTIRDIGDVTGLSTVSVKKALAYLNEKGLVVYHKRKPIVAEYNRTHPIHRLLAGYMGPENDSPSIRYPGNIPFRETMETPEMIEKALYRQIDENLAVKDTGFQVKGKSDTISILESVPGELTNEEIFLRKLFTTEGAEEYCILMLKQGLVNYEKLIRHAEEQGITNVVGCYLDILNGIDGKLIPLSAIKKFMKYMPKTKKVFLSREREFGKQGWEKPYEERWNLDLYLDIGAIRHGVRSL